MNDVRSGGYRPVGRGSPPPSRVPNQSSSVQSGAPQRDRGPTNSLLPEQSLLGTLIGNSARFEEVWPSLRPEHFSDPLHQRLYERIGAIVNSGGRADLVTLTPWIQRDEDGQHEGGVAYLLKLARAMQPTALKDYARAILEAWRRRRLQDLGRKLLADASDPNLTFDDIAASVDAELERAQDGHQSREGSSFATALSTGLDRVREAIKNKGTGGLRIGMPNLARIMPLLPARFIVVAGYSGVGKSSLVWGWAVEEAREMLVDAAGRELTDPYTGEVTVVPPQPDVGHILGISLEMGAPDLSLRAACAESGVPYAAATAGFPECEAADALRLEGKHAEAETVHAEYRAAMLARLEKAQADLGNLPLWFEDMGRLTPKMIQMKARSLRRKFARVRAIIIDHMQLVAGEPSKSGNGILDLANVIHSIMELAKEFQCPVIGLAQLKRELAEREDKRPQTSDLAWGHAFETDADAVLLIHRAEFWIAKREPKEWQGGVEGDFNDLHAEWLDEMDAAYGRGDLFLDKYRHGSPGHIPVWFHHETMKFEEDLESIVRERKAAKADAERRAQRRRQQVEQQGARSWHERHDDG